MGRAVRSVGAALLAVVAGVHLYLYLRAGYHEIPTIGKLFLLNVVMSAVLAVAVAAVGRPEICIGAGLFALATFGGYLLSLTVGLFGFKETDNVAAAVIAAVAEVGAAGLFGAEAIRWLRAPGRDWWSFRAVSPTGAARSSRARR